MMTSSDQTEMTDGVDCGGTRWTGCLDARAVERFCSELEQVRLIVVRASRRLATHWPTCQPGCSPGLSADGIQSNAKVDTDALLVTPPSHDGA
jgi:hypothetical protein